MRVEDLATIGQVAEGAACRLNVAEHAARTGKITPVGRLGGPSGVRLFDRRSAVETVRQLVADRRRSPAYAPMSGD